MADTRTLYDEDFVAWTERQAQALDRIVAHETPTALRRAVTDLRQFGEIDPAIGAALQHTRYTVDQVLGDWFPPDQTRR